MIHRVSKRNAFGASFAIGLGLVTAKILGAFLLAGVMYAVQRLLV